MMILRLVLAQPNKYELRDYDLAHKKMIIRSCSEYSVQQLKDLYAQFPHMFWPKSQ